jgi:uncharacterized membrane protein (Fun14 family)
MLPYTWLYQYYRGIKTVVIAYLQPNQGAASRIMNIVDSLGRTAATLGDGFFVGVLIGYALKKVIKIIAVVVWLFLDGLAYLQYDQIINVTGIR